MADDFVGFNTKHPEYKKVREEFDKATEKTQKEYTEKVDRIADNKARKLANED